MLILTETFKVKRLTGHHFFWLCRR